MPATAPFPETDPVPALVRKAQAGDEQAFGALMRSHYEPVFRLVCAVIRNEHDARDVCQEVWLTVWKQLATFRGDAKFTTWLHSVATRRAIDHLRKRRRWFDRFLPFAGDDTDDANVPAAPEAVATAGDARDESDRHERLELFRRALEALPPKQRAVLALRELQGLSYEEIAAATNIPTGTVMSRLYHARRLLAQKLGAKP